MDKKSRVEKLEGMTGSMDSDPSWREKVARDMLRIFRLIEKTFDREPEPEETIIAREIKQLECWPNERAYREHIDRMAPLLDELFDRVKSDAEAAA